MSDEYETAYHTKVFVIVSRVLLQNSPFVWDSK